MIDPDPKDLVPAEAPAEAPDEVELLVDLPIPAPDDSLGIMLQAAYLRGECTREQYLHALEQRRIAAKPFPSKVKP